MTDKWTQLAIQERFTEQDYLGPCTSKQKPACRKLAEQPYGDMCAEHGKARAWMRQALSREPGPYSDAEQIRGAMAFRIALRAPVIVDDPTCLPSKPCGECGRCVAAMNGMSA